MTGAEATAHRLHLGYTRDALAKLLGLSEPTVLRREATAQVPPEYAQALQALPPAPTTGRGPYQRAALASPAKPPPLRNRAATSQRPKPRPVKGQQVPAPAAAPAIRQERVYEAEEIGAVLLEGAELRAYWERVNACRHLLLWRRSQRQARRAPCR